MHMERHSGRTGGSLSATLLLGVSAILLVICIVYAPGEAFHASGQGLAIWWRVVFPALLPFLMLSEILLASGFAHGLGTLLEPWTKRWLGLPGPFAWVLPLGMTAGFPAAASAATTLYKQRDISAKEAEKITFAAHFASPMLVVIVVGTGYMGHQKLGLLLLAVHWISGLATGITMHLLASGMRFRRQRPAATTEKTAPSPRARSRFHLAALRMEEARQADGRSFGKLLGDAVSSSVQTLMTIGGYMLIFSVVIHVLVSALPSWMPSFSIAGLLEVHLGTYSAAQLSIPPAIVSALLSAMLGWGGISAFLQIRSLLKPAGIGSRSFFMSRMIHGAYAYILTLILWGPCSHWLQDVLPATAEVKTRPVSGNMPTYLPDWKQIYSLVQSQFWLLLVLCIVILGLSLITIRRSH